MNMDIRVLVRTVVVLAMAGASASAFAVTKTYNAGGGDENWSTPTNWSTNSVPTSGDDVVIANAGTGIVRITLVDPTVKTIVVQNGAELRIETGRVLNVTVSTTVNSGGVLHLGNGDFAGNGSLIVNGQVQVNGAVLGGSGAMTINGSGSMTIGSTSQISDIARSIINAGTITFVNSDTVDTTFSGATIANTGTIDFQNNFDLNASAGSHILNNNSGGLIVKSSGTGTTELNLTINNAAGATIETQTGDMELNGGGTVSGAYTIAASQFIRLRAGAYTMSGSPSLGGGGRVLIEGATLDAGAGVDVTWPNIELKSGTITGPGALRVSGTFKWLGGTIAGSGARVLNSTSAPSITCSASDCLLDGATLQLQASTVFDAVTANLVFSNGASLIIAAGKSVSITHSGDVFDGGGAPSSIINNGTIWKNNTNGTSTFAVPVTFAGGSTLQIDDGKVLFSADVTVAATATIAIVASENLEIAGGVFLFNGSGTNATGNVTVSGGTLRVPTGITRSIANVTLQGSGVLDGGGTLILTVTANWLGGAMGSAAAPGGITQINFGDGINVTPVVPISLTQTRQLLNSGTIAYGSVGANILTMSGNGKITNNGAINFNDGTIGLSGSALVDNFGSMTKVAGAGTTAILPAVNNNSGATVSVPAGTITFSGGGIAAGAYAITSVLTLTAGTFTVASTSTVTGAGTLAINGATADISSGANVTWPNVNLNAGTIGGAGTLHVSGTFNWLGGTIGGSGPRVLDGTSTPTIGCATCTLDGAALQLQASATFSGSALVFSNGASLTIDPGKTLSVTNDGNVTNGGGAGSSIINNGTLTKNGGTGNSTFQPAVNSTGTVGVTTGTFAFAGGGTHSGSFNITAPGNLSFPSGTQIMSGGSINGTGTLTVNGATVTAGVPVNVGALHISGGTLTLNAGGSAVSAFAMTSGTLGGSATLTLTNGGTWTGGTMSGSGTTINPAAQILNIPTPVTLNSRLLQNIGTLTIGGNVLGSGTLDNQGVLNAGANVTIAPAVNNSGQVATSDLLVLTGGGTHTGSFNVSTPGNLSFSSGTYSLGGGGSIAGTGTVSFSGSTATVNVPITVGAMNVSAGSATLNANASADAFTMNGGTIGGTGTLTVNNGGTWSGGTMSGSGTTINPATKSFSISAPVTLSGRTLRNGGTLDVSGATVSGSGTIDNTGAITDTTGATINAPMNNSGQVTTSALLSLGGNGSHTGTFTASGPSSVINFSGGTQTISGPLPGTGKFRFSGAAATVNGAWSGMAIDVTGGSVAFNTSGTMPALSLSGGTIAGSGALTVTGSSTWSGGTIGGSGALTFDAGAIVAMPGTSGMTLARPLLNNGIINFAASSSAMLIDGVPVTNNGTFDIQSTQGIMVTAGTPPFTNGGTLKKSAGAGVVQFAAPLMNTGAVEIEAGTLNVSGTYAQSAGTTDVRPGATLQTAMLSLNGGSLIGNGTIAGAVDNHAVVAPGASPGTLTISGDYVQASNGALDIQLDGTAPGTQYDRLAVSGNVTLDGTLNVSTIGGFVPLVGNAFQILSFGARPGATTFAVTNGLDYDATTVIVPVFGSNDLQLITNNVQADLFALVSAPQAVANGGAFTYSVTVINQGGSNATGVAVNITLPPNVTFNAASPASCNGASSLVCTVGALPNQSSAVLVLSVTANASGGAPISVSAVANEFDPNSVNNTASASTSITAVADVRIALSGTPSTVAGSRAIYTITVTNGGPDTANNVAVSVAASPGLTFNANSGACSGSFPCTIVALSSGQSATIVSAWDISPSAVGSLQLTVAAAAPAADPHPSDNSASATTLIGTCPAITINAPGELRSGATAEAVATPFAGAAYNWSITNGTIDSGFGTGSITFTAGIAGTATLTVNVSTDGCTLGASFLVTVKPRQTCQGTAMPAQPIDGTTTSDAVVTFRWNAIGGSSGYRVWLQQGDAPAQNLGTTTDTSLTKVIPPGAHHWYVETLFDGCASHESEHLVLIVLPGQDCATHGAPQLTAPANDAPASTSTIAFSWGSVANAIEYELWLAPAGGVPTLIRTTSDTSYIATVPPGVPEWYVRAIFGGCAATESDHRTFTYTPPPDCTSQRPLLIAPADGERLTSPVSFEWRAVTGATSYELYLDGVLAATTTSPRASDIPAPMDERRWQVRARLGEHCAALDSAERRFAVIAAPPSCTALEAPVVTAPGQISTGVTGRIQWTFVAGATAYVVQVSSDPQFPPVSTTSTTVTARQLPFTFTNESSLPVARYVRVHAVDTACLVPGSGPFSPVAMVSVLPRTEGNGVALLSDPTDLPYTLNIAAELAGLSFSARPDVPWITVTPASGIVPPGGQTLRALAHTADLPAGATTGTVVITTTAAAAGTRRALVDPPPESNTITVNSITGATSKTKSTPPPDALTIPAVAKVQGYGISYESDVCITNTSALPIEYELNFVPSGSSGITAGQSTTVTIASGATIALENVVGTWFGGTASTGTLEIHPKTDAGTSTSTAPANGLANRVTFASSRTSAVIEGGGTYGQHVPAIPYIEYAGKGDILSMQQIAQSKTKHTNLGLVEGSGDPVSLQVRIFGADGTPHGDFNVNLNGGEHKQLNSVLAEHGVTTLSDGRIEVEVTDGTGRVTAYASVIEDKGSAAMLVPPATIAGAGHTKWVVPGVAGLPSGSGNWQSDVRIFNAEKNAVDLTLTFYSTSGNASTKTITLAASEVRQFNGALASFFGISEAAGALHVSTVDPARLVVTARTYNQTAKGDYGEFIAGVTPEEAVAAGSRALQIVQVEESNDNHSNVGFAEVTGKAVMLLVSVFPANSHVAAKTREVTLGPNQFLQFNSFFADLGLSNLYNARISVSVVSGEGRATAYVSLINAATKAPTYLPGQ
jgi:uncharacterized repeat protein (TIGR01451 family)